MSECTPDERAMLDALNRPGAIYAMPAPTIYEPGTASRDRMRFEAASRILAGIASREDSYDLSNNSHGGAEANAADAAVRWADALLSALAQPPEGK